MLAFSCSPGTLCTKESTSLNQDEWLRQFDVSLPGCTLKKQVDILALIKQVWHPSLLLSFVLDTVSKKL